MEKCGAVLSVFEYPLWTCRMEFCMRYLCYVRFIFCGMKATTFEPMEDTLSSRLFNFFSAAGASLTAFRLQI